MAVDDELDPGLPAERTELAWSRSGLAMLGCAALVARRFVPVEPGAELAALMVLLGVSGVAWAGALLAARRVRPGAPAEPSADRRLRMATLSTTAIAAAAFVVALFPLPD